MRYKLLIVWGDVEPELWPTDSSYTDYDHVLQAARRIRNANGNGDGLYYLEWEEGERDSISVGAFGGAELEDEDEV